MKHLQLVSKFSIFEATFLIFVSTVHQLFIVLNSTKSQLVNSILSKVVKLSSIVSTTIKVFKESKLISFSKRTVMISDAAKLIHKTIKLYESEPHFLRLLFGNDTTGQLLN